MSSTTSPKYIVVAHEPIEVPAAIIKASSIRKAVGTTTYYTATPAELTAFDADINNTKDAEAATKTTPPTLTPAARDTVKRTMDGTVEKYRLIAQGLVNLPPNEAIANEIAESFDMELKVNTPRGKQQDEILDGPLPGTALYRMKGTGPHQLQISFDGGITSNDLPPTSKGHAVINGLSPKKDFWLRNRQVLTHDRYGDWSPWLPFLLRK